MKITKEQVLKKLKTVKDPELNVSIVDLGLIYKIQVAPHFAKATLGARKVTILMTLTTPGCPLAGMIQEMIKEALKGYKVEIELTFDPPWTVQLASKKLRAEYGWD